MLIKTCFAGFGGQGVMLMGYSLAYTAMMEDKHVTYLPAYGAEVRGGTANCTVVVSDEEIASPVASEPEFVVVMNHPSMVKLQNTLQSGGAMLINSALVEQRPIRGDIEICEVPATTIAEELGNTRTANMVMLGAFVRKSAIVSIESLAANLEDIMGPRRKKLVEINQKAINKGYKCLNGAG